MDVFLQARSRVAGKQGVGAKEVEQGKVVGADYSASVMGVSG